MTIIRVLPLWAKLPKDDKVRRKVVSTVARHNKDLSPFLLGPCDLWKGLVSKNMENVWQFSKVYKQHVDEDGDPTPDWLRWAKTGWRDPKAHRYPMGKGAVPLFSYWDGMKLGYVEARKHIYVPLYAEQVQKTKTYRELRTDFRNNTYDEIVLLDYDAYDHYKLGYNLTRVLNDSQRKMGHAFVLAMLLEKDIALNQCEMR